MKRRVMAVLEHPGGWLKMSASPPKLDMARVPEACPVTTHFGLLSRSRPSLPLQVWAIAD